MSNCTAITIYPWVGVTPEIIKVCGVVCVLMVGWNIIVMVYVKLVAVFVCIVHLFETMMRYYEKFMKVFNAVKCFWKPRSPIPSVIIKNFKISHPSPTRPPSSLHVVETPAKPLMEIVAEPIAKPLVEVVAETPAKPKPLVEVVAETPAKPLVEVVAEPPAKPLVEITGSQVVVVSSARLQCSAMTLKKTRCSRGVAAGCGPYCRQHFGMYK